MLLLTSCGASLKPASNFVSILWSAEGQPRRRVRALLQGNDQQRPWPHHLRTKPFREDRQHLHTPASFLPTFQTGLWPADRLTDSPERAADRADQHQQPQQQSGLADKLPLPEPVPQPACPGAGRGPHGAALPSEHLPAEGLRLRGPEEVQRVPVKRLQRSEDSERSSVHEEENTRSECFLLKRTKDWLFELLHTLGRQIILTALATVEVPHYTARLLHYCCTVAPPPEK